MQEKEDEESRAKAGLGKAKKTLGKKSKVRDTIDTQMRLSDVVDTTSVLADGVADRIGLAQAIDNSDVSLRDVVSSNFEIADVTQRDVDTRKDFKTHARLSQIVDEDISLSDVIAQDTTLQQVLPREMLTRSVLPDGTPVDMAFPGSRRISDLIPEDTRLADTMRKTPLRAVLEDKRLGDTLRSPSPVHTMRGPSPVHTMGGPSPVRTLGGPSPGDISRLSPMEFVNDLHRSKSPKANRVMFSLPTILSVFNRELKLRDIIPAEIKLAHVINVNSPRFRQISPNGDLTIIPCTLCLRDVIPPNICAIDLISSDTVENLDVYVSESFMTPEQLIRSVPLSQIVGRNTHVHELFEMQTTLLDVAPAIAKKVNKDVAASIPARNVIKPMLVCDLLSSLIKLGDAISSNADLRGMLVRPLSPRLLDPFAGRVSPLNLDIGRHVTVSRISCYIFSASHTRCSTSLFVFAAATVFSCPGNTMVCFQSCTALLLLR